MIYSLPALSISSPRDRSDHDKRKSSGPVILGNVSKMKQVSWSAFACKQNEAGELVIMCNVGKRKQVSWSLCVM
jgi:hypothetical protein